MGPATVAALTLRGIRHPVTQSARETARATRDDIGFQEYKQLRYFSYTGLNGSERASIMFEFSPAVTYGNFEVVCTGSELYKMPVNKWSTASNHEKASVTARLRAAREKSAHLGAHGELRKRGSEKKSPWRPEKVAITVPQLMHNPSPLLKWPHCTGGKYVASTQLFPLNNVLLVDRLIKDVMEHERRENK